MFHKNLFKDWSSSHLLDYGWYLDYPKDYTPQSKFAFYKRIDPSFQSKLHASLTVPIEASKKRGRRKGKE
jgi:hypothetical protein